ncbi:hypothetical protein [Helicobacter sp.]|uniref:hypothetical protein n=1 Tax=Helicobacter sp. TaxID=218 RepID=UPI001983A984|nr:hypothetical protein [Helicobacter sp.]MBD5165650.1 hypothetical protein [Helicobacter sp.]
MKWIWGVGLFLFIAGYFYFSPSYNLSREAKREFAKGNFESSYHLATQALEADPYNRSALGISSQSKQRLNVQNFLQKTKQNYERALEILKHGSLSPQEFLQLRWITEEFEKDYQALVMLNNPDEVEEMQLKQYQDWFLQLQNRLNQAQQSLQKGQNRAK